MRKITQTEPHNLPPDIEMMGKRVVFTHIVTKMRESVAMVRRTSYWEWKREGEGWVTGFRHIRFGTTRYNHSEEWEFGDFRPEGIIKVALVVTHPNRNPFMVPPSRIKTLETQNRS